MSAASLIKCICALAIISLYIWLFFVVDLVGEEDAELEKEQAEYADVSETNAAVNSLQGFFTTSEISASEIQPDDPALTSYDTTVNVTNGKKPSAVDFPAQITPDFYVDTAATQIIATTAAAASATTTAPAVTTVVTTTPAVTTIATAMETTVSNTRPAETGLGETEKLTVNAGGQIITDTALNIVSRIVQNEIGSGFEPEAIKAQAAAAYTYVKMRNDNGAEAAVNLANVASERVINAVREVLGQAIYYNGEMISAVYCASSAGYTASSKNVWGADLPYLQSVQCELDPLYDPNYKQKYAISSQELMLQVAAATGIELTGNPAEWIKIINRVDTVYNGDIILGGHTTYTKNGETTGITGRVFREKIMAGKTIGGKKFPSASFEVSYSPVTDMFTFTTYGYGHGAGMSQNGANILAKYKGYNYKQILEFYYKGVTVK